MSSQHVPWLARARRLLAEPAFERMTVEIAVSQAPEESIDLLEGWLPGRTVVNR